MNVYPASLALSGLSREDRAGFAVEADLAWLWKPTCGRCQHPMEPSELDARSCMVCGAPAHFAFGPVDRDGKTVADFVDVRR